MLIYFSLILLICIQSIPSFISSNKSLEKISIFLFFIELFIILGFKSYIVGPDSASYYGMFLSILNNPTYNGGIEYGYFLFNKIIGCVSCDPQILFIAIGLIIAYTISKLIYKKSPIVFISIIIYLTIGTFLFNLSGLRQSLAISICILSYQFILDRKFVPFMIFVFVASTFHYSAYSFLIAYPLYNLKINRKNLMIFFIISLFIMIFSKSFINIVLHVFPSYQGYLDSESRFGRNIIGGDIRSASIFKFAINFVVLIFSLFVWSKIKNLPYKIYMELKLLISFSLLATIILLSSINATVFERVAMYFNSFYIILIPKIIVCIKDKNIRMVSSILVVSFCLLYIIMISIYRPEWNAFLNYNFCW